MTTELSFSEIVVDIFLRHGPRRMAFWQAMMPDDIAEEDGARYIGFTKRREKCDGQIEQKKFSFFT